MNNTKRFLVTEEHLKLLDNMWIGYNDWTEFGAPEVDPKRPYGNSDVYGDIAEIIGLEAERDSWGDIQYTTEQKDRMLELHKEMQHVLQILVVNRSIEPGYYEASAYGVNWKKVT